MKTHPYFLSLVLFLLGASTLQAQLVLPLPSPNAAVTQTVGLNNFTINYSRPGVKGRKIFGDLVPFGQLWRTGANSATRLQADRDFTLAGQKVKAGTYSIFSIPGETSWTIILNNKYDQAGTDGYKQEEDALRVMVTPTALADMTESFTIEFGNVTERAATLDLRWEKTLLSIPLQVDVEAAVKGNLQTAMDGVYATYVQSAGYYLDHNMDLQTALNYANNAVALKETFFGRYTRSRILAALQRYPEAIKDAQRSKELSLAAANDTFVRLNDANITAWGAKVAPAPAKKKS